MCVEKVVKEVVETGCGNGGVLVVVVVVVVRVRVSLKAVFWLVVRW